MAMANFETQWLRRREGPMTAELRLDASAPGPGRLPERLTPSTTVGTVCGFCSTGCNLTVHIKDGRPVNLTADPAYPVNRGSACPKGWEALAPLAAPDRAVTPLLRDADSGALIPVDWDTAMRTLAVRLRALMAAHGPESVAFLSSGQIATEEMALLGALWRFGLGAQHGDSNTRQCMATTHVAYKQSFGFDAPPFTYADFEVSDVLIFIGANPCIAHPILWERVLRNPHRPAIVVIDPRKTETAMNATQHVALAPKSDLVLFYGLAHLLISMGHVDRGFIERSTTGFEAFSLFVRAYTPDRVAAETGLTVGDLYRLAQTIARGRAVSFWWTMGVNQGHESTRTAQAIVNLALLTGNIGRPGTGPNSITGQCNAMGSRLFSNTSSLLAGRDFHNPAHRADVAHRLGFPLECIPSVPSIPYDEIVNRVSDGRIKGLWVIGTNPAHSWIGRGRTAGAGQAAANTSAGFDAALDRLEFLVVQDMYTTTETARRAHLLLPAAGWGEKEGTFINSERRIGVIRKVARAPGQALADFHIFRLAADYLGCASLLKRWTSPEAVFRILGELSQGRPCDFSGIEGYHHLDRAGGLQWPVPATADSKPIDTERRLFADGRFFHGDGRARFLFDPPAPKPENTDRDFPFVLLTGRSSSAQWHTLTRTGKSPLLERLAPRHTQLEIHPTDATHLGITMNSRVRVTSRRGSMEARALLTSTIQSGQVFLPMHDPRTNQLTLANFDTHSRQPGYKFCAVKVEPIEAPAP